MKRLKCHVPAPKKIRADEGVVPTPIQSLPGGVGLPFAPLTACAGRRTLKRTTRPPGGDPLPPFGPATPMSAIFGGCSTFGATDSKWPITRSICPCTTYSDQCAFAQSAATPTPPPSGRASRCVPRRAVFTPPKSRDRGKRRQPERGGCAATAAVRAGRVPGGGIYCPRRAPRYARPARRRCRSPSA
jgi:hypothetical protein